MPKPRAEQHRDCHGGNQAKTREDLAQYGGQIVEKIRHRHGGIEEPADGEHPDHEDQPQRAPAALFGSFLPEDSVQEVATCIRVSVQNEGPDEHGVVFSMAHGIPNGTPTSFTRAQDSRSKELIHESAESNL